MLLSKINAQMLIKCEQGISNGQINELQKYKSKAESFDSSKPEYRDLVSVDFSQYDITTENENGYTVSFTNPENAMLNQVEDINDSMNREIQKDN